MAISNAEHTTILGYYSLCPGGLEYARAPEMVRKGLARHDVPVFRLVRLAVSRSVQGQGLGGELIFAAGRRCLRPRRRSAVSPCSSTLRTSELRGGIRPMAPSRSRMIPSL